MSSPKETPEGLGTAAVALAAFLWLFHYVGIETWGHGKVTFVRLLALLGVVVAVPRLRALEARVGTTRLLAALALGYGAVLAAGLVTALQVELATRGRERVAIDIAQNVHAAGTLLLDGQNPYTHRAQLGHPIEPSAHVTFEDGEVRMYGLRYPYGFPYFPTMILAYLPFRGLAAQYHAIRIGNLVYLAIAAVAAAALAAQSVPRGRRLLAASLAPIATLSISVMAAEHVTLAVTDVCIAAAATLGYVALGAGRPRLAGVLLGLAQGAKLLPGPLLVLPALAALGDRPARVRLLSAYLLTSIACVLPGLVPDPEAFVASTIAFYLTYHGAGDDTSLYWYLPEGLKAPFLLVGAIVALGFAGAGFRRRPPTAAHAAGLAWLSYVGFTVFNRMTHLNYLWAVHSLGAAALVAQALAARAPGVSEPASGPASDSPR